MTYGNILKINYGIYYHQTRKHCAFSHTTLSHTRSLPSLFFFSSSSVCRQCGSIRWADWAVLLPSTCLLNDSNYFPGLQATHACFISTSTSPICLPAWPCMVHCGGMTKKQHFISLQTLLWLSTGFSTPSWFTEGGPVLFSYNTRGIVIGTNRCR